MPLTHVLFQTDSREQADLWADAVDEWEQEFPHKRMSWVVNPAAVTLHGDIVIDVSDSDALTYRLLFLFEDARDATLFKLRYYDNDGQSTS